MTVDYTNRDKTQAQSQAKAAGYDMGLRAYMLKVYNHMSIGVGITGLVAYFASQSTALMQAIYGTPLQWVVMFAPLVFVLIYSSRIHKMSEAGAKFGFYAFSAVMGLSLSYIFLAYTQTSVVRVFFITSAMFGAMSLWGYTTKKDLTGMGSFLIMGLFGIIIASIVNIFMQSSAMYYAISYLGIAIFTGLIMYDTQKIKNTYYQVGVNDLGKAAIMGALNLYLDFINLMIMLLRVMGDRK